MAEPFSQCSFLSCRYWTFLVVYLLVAPYFLGKLNFYEAITLSFAIILGLTGLSPQYLIWLVPFLLITRRFLFAALYNIITSTFLLLYYINPLSSHFPYENMTSFASLRDFGWLMPSLSFSSEKLLPIIRIMGDYLIPLTCVSFAIFLTWQMCTGWRSSTDRKWLTAMSGQFPRVYIIFIAAFFAIIVLFGLRFLGVNFLSQFDQDFTRKISEYALVQSSANNLEPVPMLRSLWGTLTKTSDYYTGVYPRDSTVNIILILFLESAIWTTLAVHFGWKTLPKRKIMSVRPLIQRKAIPE